MLIGNGDGSFKAPVSYASGTQPLAVTIADVNEDGRPDIIVANAGGGTNTPGTVSVLFGNGDGTFQPETLYSADSGAVAVVAADFNGDGRLDIAAGNRFSNDVSVLLNAAPGGNLSSTTVTVNVAAPNHAPTITAASFSVSEGGIAPVTLASIGITDPDSSSFSFSVTNVTHGKFQTTTDGTHWTDATTFTTADLTQNHVRFVQNDDVLTPTFSIQANDGAAVNNLSNVFAGSVTFTPFANASHGDGGNNTLTGTPANDALQGFGGDDTINGLGGIDRAIYSDATGGITVDMAAGTVSGAGVGNDTLTGVEAIIGSDFVDHFTAAGYIGDSAVPGVSAGFNSFEGRGGDDVITGNVNQQGQALTRIVYSSATSAVTVDLAAGTATGDTSVGTDHFTNVSIVVGSAFNDTLLGSNNANGTFEQFDGAAGNDLINGRGGYDFVAYNADVGTVSGITVNLAAGTVVGDASIGTDTLQAVEGIRGTNFADTYDATGFSGTSTNAGSIGTFNNFDGQGGNDTIIGNGNTRLQFTQASAGVTVDLTLGKAHSTAGVTCPGPATIPSAASTTSWGRCSTTPCSAAPATTPSRALEGTTPSTAAAASTPPPTTS